MKETDDQKKKPPPPQDHIRDYAWFSKRRSRKKRRIKRIVANICLLWPGKIPSILVLTAHLTFTNLSFQLVYPFGRWENRGIKRLIIICFQIATPIPLCHSHLPLIFCLCFTPYLIIYRKSRNTTSSLPQYIQNLSTSHHWYMLVWNTIIFQLACCNKNQADCFSTTAPSSLFLKE